MASYTVFYHLEPEALELLERRACGKIEKQHAKASRKAYKDHEKIVQRYMKELKKTNMLPISQEAQEVGERAQAENKVLTNIFEFDGLPKKAKAPTKAKPAPKPKAKPAQVAPIKPEPKPEPIKPQTPTPIYNGAGLTGSELEALERLCNSILAGLPSKILAQAHDRAKAGIIPAHKSSLYIVTQALSRLTAKQQKAA